MLNIFRFFFLNLYRFLKSQVQKGEKGTAQRGARTHDTEIKSLVLYRLS